MKQAEKKTSIVEKPKKDLGSSIKGTKDLSKPQIPPLGSRDGPSKRT
jgi:hypothetical protein